jgi:polyisoprenoid-binding protein YceI
MSTVEEQVTATGVSTWQIDPNHSLAEFSAKHMMITTVKGRFGKVSGTITVDERNPDRSRVEAEIDAASIDTRADQRDQHLRSPDFLDVESYPTITFLSRRVEGSSRNPGDEFRVIGDLTIRGTTREVTPSCGVRGHREGPLGRGAGQLQRHCKDRPARLRADLESGPGGWWSAGGKRDQDLDRSAGGEAIAGQHTLSP